MIIRPFTALRPSAGYASKVAALPYDVMSSDEARKMVESNPYSFLHVDKSEIDLPTDCDIYSQQVYDKAAQNLQRLIDDGILIMDGKPCLYVYRLTANGKSQTGLVCCTSVDDYLNNSIKKHELTRADKEKDRTKHIDVTSAHTGPIFMAYRDEKGINTMINDAIVSGAAKHLYDFTSDDGIEHAAWIIESDEHTENIIQLFAEIPCLYIADGHHRNAAAVNVAKAYREKNPDYSGKEEYNYYLSILFPENQLKIFDYNRVVKDLNGMSAEQFIDALSYNFIVKPVATQFGKGYRPSKKYTFGMYIDGAWYALQTRDGIVDENDIVESLDVSVLQKYILDELLGIKDLRTDDRIDFIGGVRGLKELERLVDSEQYKVAFSMFPTSMPELMSIADAGELMPPKSTWFEPKLKSGLFIHKI